MINFDNEIIEVIAAAEPVAWFIGRSPEGAVVAAVGWVLAPSVGRADAAHGQQGARTRQAIGAPPEPQGVKAATRGAAVTFALIGANTAAAECDGHGQRAGDQPTLRASVRPRADVDASEPSPSLAVAGSTSHASFPSYRLLFCPRMFYFAQRSTAKSRPSEAERGAAPLTGRARRLGAWVDAEYA